MRRRVYACSLSLALVAGCSLFTDFGGLSGGPSVDAGTTDGSRAVAGDGAALDAADGGTTADASGCARFPDASFCVDFDRPAALTTGTWSEIEPTTPADRTIDLTTLAPVSPPNAAAIQLRNASAGDCKYLRLIRRFSGALTRTSVRFAVRAETSGVVVSTTFGVRAGLSFDVLVSFDEDRQVHLFVQRNTNNNITEEGASNVFLASRLIGRWVEMTVDYTITPNAATVTVEGQVATVPLRPDLIGRDPEASFGAFCAATPTQFAYDDVAITVTP